jgi:Tat protein translocase TatB subunit
MFGIGTGELVIIFIVALIIIGPQKLPEIARTMGKAMGELKRATRDIQDEMRLDDLLKENDDRGPTTVSRSGSSTTQPPKAS